MRKSSIFILGISLFLGACAPLPLPESYTEMTTQVPDKGSVSQPLPTNTVTPTPEPDTQEDKTEEKSFAEYVAQIPDYAGDFIIDIPAYGFEKGEMVAYERYSELDALGRCGVAEALIGKEIMPTEPRGEIGMVKPTGWHTVRYDELIEDKYLYNRCHIVGYQLTGENANVKNLITGTRYFNVDGMEPYESMVAGYIRMTGNHVYYRVTPVFDGDNLLCKGVWMEAESAEDNGSGVKYSIFIYNIQPGIWIDYVTGDSCVAAERGMEQNYVLNTKTKKFHEPDCKNIADIGKNNKKDYKGTREALTEDGYTPCGWCGP